MPGSIAGRLIVAAAGMRAGWQERGPAAAKLPEMALADPAPGYPVLHLPAQSVDWAGILAQFALAVSAREGQLYARWATERLRRATETSEGLVALAKDGALLGMILFEIVDQAAEMTLPWTRKADHRLQAVLVEAALAVLREEYGGLRFLRAERQLLPGEMAVSGLEAAGFCCVRRQRMLLELAGWREPLRLPAGCSLHPWNIAFLDEVAGVVFRANRGTIDERLYAPFFGDSPADCRIGLLAILAGKFGPLDQAATQCACAGGQVVGVNLVITEESGQATIVEISVDPAWQQRGVGRALLVQGLACLQEAHCERVELAVTRDNACAVHLYESLGFVDIGFFPVCYWPDGFPIR